MFSRAAASLHVCLQSPRLLEEKNKRKNAPTFEMVLLLVGASLFKELVTGGKVANGREDGGHGVAGRNPSLTVMRDGGNSKANESQTSSPK